MAHTDPGWPLTARFHHATLGRVRDVPATRMDSAQATGQVVVRFDVGYLGNVERTPQGGLRVPAYLTRAGVFEYLRADGTVFREYRPPEEVFHQDSLATLQDAPVTDLHPTDPEMVTPRNFRELACGHTREPRQDGDKVEARLVIQDADLVAKVLRKDATEVSCGYTCRVDFTPGVAPDGQRYDAVQRSIRYNHVAIVPRGRAGSDVCLRLDAAGNVVAPGATMNGDRPREEIRTMETMRIDGVDYPLGTEAERQAAVQAFQRFQAKLDAQVAALTQERDRQAARADAAEASVSELRVKLDAAQDPKRLDAAVQARVRLHTQARAILGREAKLDGLTDLEVQRAVIHKVLPQVKLDGRSEEYVAAMFDACIARVDADRAKDPDNLGGLRSALAPRRDAEDEDEKEDEDEDAPRKDAAPDSAKARRRMDRANRLAWTRPLALTKDTPRA